MDEPWGFYTRAPLQRKGPVLEGPWVSFAQMLEQPGSGIETTKHANLPKWKQRMLETCIEDDGSFNVGLYRGLKSDICLHDYMDIQEALIVHRDRTASFRAFIEDVYQAQDKKRKPKKANVGVPVDLNAPVEASTTPEGEEESSGSLPVEIPISVLQKVFPGKTDAELESMARFQAREISKIRGDAQQEMDSPPVDVQVSHLFSTLSNGEWGGR